MMSEKKTLKTPAAHCPREPVPQALERPRFPAHVLRHSPCYDPADFLFDDYVFDDDFLDDHLFDDHVFDDHVFADHVFDDHVFDDNLDYVSDDDDSSERAFTHARAAGK